VWRSADGRFNTVAVPSPSSVLGQGVAAHLERLVDLHGPERLDAALERAQDRVFAEAAEEWDQSEEDRHKALVPEWSGEVELVDDPDAFFSALAAASGPRWALDVLLAAEDAADQATDRG
jgi:hypothetical protein